MTANLTADDLLAFHKATGIPMSHARSELLELEPDLRARVLVAVRAGEPAGIGLTDPIEQDPVIGSQVRMAAKRAEELVGEIGLGRCHAIWELQAEILWIDHQIRWYSPAQMNPWICFD